MADETQSTEMVNADAAEMDAPAAVETTAQPTQPAAATVDTGALQAELDKARAALKAANKEAAERRKALEAFEKSEQERKEAEMTELQKLQSQLERERKEREVTAAELEKLRINDQKRNIAAKVGLPPEFALRIQGDSDEAMEEDAAAMLAAMPKAAKAAAPNPGATNPGAGASANETLEQKRARIFGSTTRDAFDPDEAARMGGGWIIRK